MPRTLNSESYNILLEMLREARLRQGITQEALASALDFRQSDISKVERGVRRLDAIELRAWITELGCPFVEFIHALDEQLSAREGLQRAGSSALKPIPKRRLR